MDVEVFSDSSVEWVKILVDGTVKDTLNDKPFRTRMYLEDGTYKLKFRARNSDGKESESGELRIGVNMPWEVTPTPVPSLVPSPTPTPTPTPTP